jgi:hypothetical protein
MAARDFSEMPAALARSWSNLSRRERLLIGAGLLAASIYAALSAHDWAQQQLVTFSDADDAVRTAKSTANNVYPRLRLETSKELDRARSWAYPAKSLSVAKVLLEEAVLNAALKGGITDAQVQSSETTDSVGPLYMIRLELTGTFSWTSFNDFVQNLDKQRFAYVIDTVEVPDEPKPKLRLDLRIPVTLESPSR